MFRHIRSLAIAAIAVLTVLGSLSGVATAQTTSGIAYFSGADGGSVAGGTFMITDADGTIIRQGNIGLRESAIFLQNDFTVGESYTLTAVAGGYQAVSQTLVAESDRVEFNVVLEPLQITKKTITIGINKGAPTDWFITEAPEGSTWTLTNVRSGKVYSGTFSGPVPQSIQLPSSVGSGTFLVQIDAGPNFLPYEDTVTIRGNTGTLYFELQPDTSVVPLS